MQIIKKYITWLSLSILFAYSFILWQDVTIYYSNVNDSSCCGWVEESVIKRPFTYLMVDSWSEGSWQSNGDKSEEWFVKDGWVDGKVEFWRVVESRGVR